MNAPVAESGHDDRGWVWGLNAFRQIESYRALGIGSNSSIIRFCLVCHLCNGSVDP
jgi:hypothetical protein